MKLFSTLTLSIIAQICQAQHPIYYSYDATGNRITRTLRSQPSKSRARQGDKDEVCIYGRNIKVKLNAEGKLVEIGVDNWKENDHMNIALYSLNGKLLMSKNCDKATITIPLLAEYDKCFILTNNKNEWYKHQLDDSIIKNIK